MDYSDFLLFVTDRDGTTDFVFPVCLPANNCSDVNSIEVVYNVQQEMCASITGNGDDCTDSENICGTKFDYSIPSVIPAESTADVVVIPKSAFTGTFFGVSPGINSIVPSTLRLGDYNADGFPDMLVVLKYNGTTHTQLWTSVACSADSVSPTRRTFARSSDASAIENVPNSFAATFFDLADDGTLDMIVLSHPTLATATPFQITTIENSVAYGTFFLKATGLSGLCMAWCDTEPKFPDPKPIGVNQPGAVFKYIWSDNNQDKRVTIGTQLSQSGYLALQAPYVYFGIGDVSHYIQYIYLGVPIENGVRFIMLFV